MTRRTHAYARTRSGSARLYGKQQSHGRNEPPQRITPLTQQRGQDSESRIQETPSTLRNRKRPRETDNKPKHHSKRQEPLSTEECIQHWVDTGGEWPEDMMLRTLARKKSVGRKRSESGSIASANTSDQQPEDLKSAPYRHSSYQIVLETEACSFMRSHTLGISKASKRMCQKLLQKRQVPPQNTIFSNEKTFLKACDRLQGKNEARIRQDFSPLIVPRAESLALLGAVHLESVVESVDEGWNNCIPITKPRPQPDYGAGFSRDAFLPDQMLKLQPFVGDPSYVSFFKATYYMYFPFLTCEVKGGSMGLDVADRQNLHSMTVGMKGIVELFKLAKREQEIHQELLGFSVSHDSESVRICGHYPIIEGDQVSFWRYPIRKFDFTEQDGKERWTAYMFTLNLYETWVPLHLSRICSAIDALPSNVATDPLPPQVTESFGMTQQLQNQSISDQTNRDEHAITPEASQSAQQSTKKARV